MKVIDDLLCLGFENGIILIYKVSDPNFCVILNPDLNEKVTCIDALDDKTKLVAGYSKGSVCLFDLNNRKIIKKMTNFVNGSILFIKFLDKNSNKPKNKIILGNSENKFFKLKSIDKDLLSINSKNKNQLENWNNVFNITELLNAVPFSFQDKKKFKIKLVAVSTLHKIFVIDMKNLKETILEFKKPEFSEEKGCEECVPFIYWEDSSSISTLVFCFKKNKKYLNFFRDHT